MTRDPGRARYGCFLPDLTGLASFPSAAGLPGEIYHDRCRAKTSSPAGAWRPAPALPASAPAAAPGGIDGDRARPAGRRRRQQVGMAEHRPALGKAPARAAASPAALTGPAERSGPRRPGAAGRAAARTLLAGKPSSLARRCHDRASPPRPISRWAALVIGAARAARREGVLRLPMPRSAIAASISARRGDPVGRLANGHCPARFGSSFETVETGWHGNNVVTLWS